VLQVLERGRAQKGPGRELREGVLRPSVPGLSWYTETPVRRFTLLNMKRAEAPSLGPRPSDDSLAPESSFVGRVQTPLAASLSKYSITFWGDTNGWVSMRTKSVSPRKPLSRHLGKYANNWRLESVLLGLHHLDDARLRVVARADAP
jgi:hypothetical protein